MKKILCLEINYNREGMVLLSRYLNNLPGSARMIKYLSKFSQDKEMIKELYKNYDLFQDVVFKEFERININSLIKSEIRDFIKPIFKNEPLSTYYLRFMYYNYDDFEVTQERINILMEDAFLTFNHRGNYEVMNIGDVIKYCDELNLDDSQKLQFISFYSNYENYTKLIMDLAFKVGEIVKKNVFIVSESIQEVESFLHNNENIEKILNKFAKYNMDLKQVKISIGLFETAYYYLHYNERTKKAGLFVNFLYPKICLIDENKKKFEIESVEAFKALSDQSRYRIIRLLSIKGSCYVQQIAKELSLSPATIIHHLEILKKAGLINMSVGSDDNKKIYYELDGKTITVISNLLLDLVQ